jgi:hypothetical protein
MTRAGRAYAVGLAILMVAALAVLWTGAQGGSWWDSPVGVTVRAFAFVVAGLGVLVGIPIGLLAATSRIVTRRLGRMGGADRGRAPLGHRPPEGAAVWQVTVDGALHRVWIRHSESGPIFAWVDERAAPVTRERDGVWTFAVDGRAATLRSILSLLGDWVTGRYEDADLTVEGGTVWRIR